METSFEEQDNESTDNMPKLPRRMPGYCDRRHRTGVVTSPWLLLGRVRDFLNSRSFLLRNAARTNVLLGLVRDHLNGDDIKAQYRTHLRAVVDATGAASWTFGTAIMTRASTPVPAPARALPRLTAGLSPAGYTVARCPLMEAQEPAAVRVTQPHWNCAATPARGRALYKSRRTTSSARRVGAMSRACVGTLWAFLGEGLRDGGAVPSAPGRTELLEVRVQEREHRVRLSSMGRQEQHQLSAHYLGKVGLAPRLSALGHS